jgi:hypothetical protein
MTLTYMVCDQQNLDVQTGQCTQVQYVQAPMMFPPLDLQSGAELGSALFVAWTLAACWKKLSNW